MSNVVIEISLFGAFRAFDASTPIKISLPQGASLTMLKDALRTRLEQQDAVLAQKTPIEESALASAHSILPENFTFQHDMALALLPPVCGG